MAKKIVGYIKLQIPAGKANPSPPVGPALGQRGLNIMQFCKEFNAVTQNMEPGMPIPVVITAFADRTFTFITKTPPNTYFLKKAAKIDKGSQTVGQGRTGRPGDHVAAARDRREQDEGHERQRHRRRGAHAGRLGPLDGPDRGGGLSRWHKDKRLKAAYAAVDTDQGLPAGRGDQAGEAERQGEVRRDGRDVDEPRHRPAPCRPDGARADQPAERHRQDGAGRRVRARAEGR